MSLWTLAEEVARAWKAWLPPEDLTPEESAIALARPLPPGTRLWWHDLTVDVGVVSTRAHWPLVEGDHLERTRSKRHKQQYVVEGHYCNSRCASRHNPLIKLRQRGRKHWASVNVSEYWQGLEDVFRTRDAIVPAWWEVDQWRAAGLDYDGPESGRECTYLEPQGSLKWRTARAWHAEGAAALGAVVGARAARLTAEDNWRDGLVPHDRD
jgi:hypothetical protein